MGCGLYCTHHEQYDTIQYREFNATKKLREWSRSACYNPGATGSFAAQSSHESRTVFDDVLRQSATTNSVSETAFAIAGILVHIFLTFIAVYTICAA